MYGKAAGLFADELFDNLSGSGLIKDDRILGGRYGETTMTFDPSKDENFLLWSLIPYIIANSGQHLLREKVSFEEAATIRPDGGHNICSADVVDPTAPKPKYDDSMGEFCGCCWNGYENLTLWQCDSEWSDKRIGEHYLAPVKQDLILIKRWLDGGELSAAEYAGLVQRGCIFVLNENGRKKVVPRVVMLENSEIRSQLLAVGDRIREKHFDEFERLKDKYIGAILKKTPPHMPKARIYGLQHIFFADPWFILHVLKRLTENEKLKTPTPEQKKMLMTVIAIDK